MGVVFAVICYFLLALLIPAGWALGRTWWKARAIRPVTCPQIGSQALVALDAGYAVRMRALGEQEIRIRDCTNWPGQADCDRECAAAMAGYRA